LACQKLPTFGQRQRRSRPVTRGINANVRVTLAVPTTRRQPQQDCLLEGYYRPGVTTTSRLTLSPSRILATASGGSTIFAFEPSAARTVTSPLLRSMSVILPAS